MAAIIFDLDGTLIDSAPDIRAAANATLEESGRDRLTLEQVVSFIGHGSARFVDRCLDATGGRGDTAFEDGFRARFKRHYSAGPTGLTTIYPGAIRALGQLRDGGHLLGICTNKPHDLAVDAVRTCGLDSLVTVVVGGGLVGELKPDPRGLFHCLELLNGSRDDVMYIGDSETDEATALAAKVPFGFFTRGYRKKQVEDFTACFRFDHFDELVDRVAELA
ncbi:MAG: phosphoglycolate phosphatase [Geminicoccaceae bacterium]